MVSSLKKRGWVGLELDQDEETGRLTVKKIVPGSPAEAAGFQPGDVLAALNGLRLDDEANATELKKAREAMLPGVKVEYTVRRSGKDVRVSVTLGSLPSDVLAQWVGMHMLEHVTPSAESSDPPK
jgi:S1-C subfamily serine protease